MNTHERKSYKRALNILHSIRKDIIKEAKADNRENVKLVRHLNPLIKYLHELLGEEIQTLTKVPKKVKKV